MYLMSSPWECGCPWASSQIRHCQDKCRRKIPAAKHSLRHSCYARCRDDPCGQRSVQSWLTVAVSDGQEYVIKGEPNSIMEIGLITVLLKFC
jgi:hypothetical protein